MNRFKYVQRSEHTKVGGEGKEETFDFCNLSPSSVIQSFICGYVSIAKLNLLLKEDKTISSSFLKWDERVTQPNKRREEKQIQVADSSHLKDVQAATHLDPPPLLMDREGHEGGRKPWAVFRTPNMKYRYIWIFSQPLLREGAYKVRWIIPAAWKMLIDPSEIML